MPLHTVLRGSRAILFLRVLEYTSSALYNAESATMNQSIDTRILIDASIQVWSQPASGFRIEARNARCWLKIGIGWPRRRVELQS